MEAKEFLRQYKEIKADLKNLDTEIKELGEQADNISISYSLDRVQTSGLSDRVGNLAAKIADKTNEAINMRFCLSEILSEIVKTIKTVGDYRLRRILYAYYIEGSSWQAIADELNMSRQWACHLHGIALLEVEKIIKEISDS
ncbi:Uncharacterised protein [uncultured Eubacterium sp.]|nr:Uncharacterised protein [uncultured Eubacterium sp.]